MTRTLKLSILFLGLLALGCKSANRISTSGELDSKLSAKQIIKAHQKQSLKLTVLVENKVLILN